MVHEKIIDEQQALIQLSQGSESAFRVIYQKYSPDLYFKLLKIIKSKLLAEEILQEAFLVVWETRRKIDSSKCFQSYINCIAINKCYDHFRKIARDKKLHDKFVKHNQLSVETDNNSVDTENEVMLSKMIEQLPPRRRLIFKLCKIDGKTYEEVSHELGISLSTISDHIVKANVFIRNRFLHAV